MFCKEGGGVILSTSCESYYDDVTVTSFEKIRYVNVAVESVPQGTAFCYSFSRRPAMLGLMGFSGSLPLYVIHRYYLT